MTAWLLRNTVRPYAWGSRTAIPEILGLAATDEPQAEMWMGAHPDAPSRVDDVGLDELIAKDPAGALGADIADRFDGRLPYLMKILAADQALSIQVHPTAEQARAGYAAEDAAGVPRDAAHRNYKDPNPKPELLCALTPFEALCGFRLVPETRRLFADLGVPELRPFDDMLAGPDGLRRAFTALVSLDAADRPKLVDAVFARVDRLPDEWAGAARAAQLAAGDFPGDVGAVVSLLLNYVVLQPGEAIFLGAGNVHAYLRGTGIEIMGNSDNVLRVALTPKHVDVPELLKIADFSPLPDPVRHAAGGSFTVPVPEFALHLQDVAGSAPLAGNGPRIALCTEGGVTVAGLDLPRGASAFVPASSGAVDVSGTGRLFVAAPGC